MSNIVEFKKPEETVPCIEGEAICIGCKHEWQAVADIGTIDLDCPECKGSKGIFKHFVERSSELHFECNCGNFLFHVTPTGFYCPNCACWVRPYD